MSYEDRLQNVTVLGAAGKMGSGILLLTAAEMADLSHKPENKGKTFTVNAMDVSQDALDGLLQYVRDQARKIAEKKTVALRKMYEDRTDLIENHDVIDQYIHDITSKIRPTTRLEPAYESTLIFEAVSENPELKIKIFSEIDKNNANKPWFFTNTSSIPILHLNEKANLEGRILGFHFYNPPIVQKLVELITNDETDRDAVDFALAYAKKLRKTIVPSNDFAGFIGNGHFMRDALHAMGEVDRLSSDMPFVEAVHTMNRISQDFLIRPMGIFQLIDYVGIDVCQYIMKVMNPHVTDEDIHSPLLDKMMELGIRGGQNPNGSQKDGFLKYEKGRPAAVFDVTSKKYVPIADFLEKADARIGTPPPSAVPWKGVIGSPDKSSILEQYFKDLAGHDTTGGRLAHTYGKRSKAIGKKLVADGVAHTEDDVNTVLLTGFFHAYGPINNYFD
ncbi:MAG: 3-hydroxyacyl-CoA dehydrogenase family protein [Candidatus Aminicenantes bacterium]|nr:3-hydroxyacyl-CoA dehydrogenase family protein [Candidatus Aminicenantes bacterium]